MQRERRKTNNTIQRPPEHARRLNENAKEVGNEGDLLNYLRHRFLSDYGFIMFSRVLNVKVTIEPEEYAGDRTGWNRWHYVCFNGGVVGLCNIEEAVIKEV
jgi:hypothetical protein